MKRLIYLLLICPVATLSAQDSAGTAAAIRSLEQQWLVAQAHNDNRTLDMIFDNQLVYVEYGRLVSKGEYLSRVKSESPSLDQITMEPTVVHVSGATAIVVGSYVEKQLHNSHYEAKRWRFVDTWIYKKNGWVLVAAGATPVSN